MILFLHPPRNFHVAKFVTIPVGAFGVVNHLRLHGYSVRGYNLPMEMQLSTTFSLKRILQYHKPKAVLIDLHWYEHTCGAIETARWVKAILPETIIVMGGLTATIFAKELILECPEVDFVIRGEGEIPTVQLFDFLFRQEGSIYNISGLTCRFHDGLFETPIRFWKTNDNADQFDYVDFSWLHNFEAYLYSTPSGLNSAYRNYWLIVGTGCPFNCSYCGGSKESLERSFKRTEMWKRSPAIVASDINRLINVGVEIINPTHDVFVFGKNYWDELFTLLQKHKDKVGVYYELFQLPSIEFLKAFAKTFRCERSTLVFSALTGDENVRRKNGKHYKNSQLLDALRSCYKLGLRAELAFSENLPGIDKNSSVKQMMLIEDARKVYPGIEFYSQEITLDPLSNMAIYPQKHGIIKQFHKLTDYLNYSSGNEKTPRRNGYQLGPSNTMP